MSMLSLQADGLREMAVKLGVNGVCTGDLFELCVMLREAADTIESMGDRLRAAELGSGTCVMNRVKMLPEHKDCIFECWECSACKRTNDEHRPRFCPNCGARVEKVN